MCDGQPGGVFSSEIIYTVPGQVTMQVTGREVEAAFRHEPGGHRFQRVPPNEKRGRVQSSSLTVAVLTVPSEQEIRVNPGDLEWKTCRGSGPGGQHRNTTDSAVQLTHKPTGISVWSQGERSQHQNKAAALAVLRTRLAAHEEKTAHKGRNTKRQGQVGSGMRGDKVRTIAQQRGTVLHHATGRKMQVKQYLRGELDPLYR